MEGKQTLEYLRVNHCVHPTIILDKAAQVLKAGEDLHGLVHLHQVVRCWTLDIWTLMWQHSQKFGFLQLMVRPNFLQ